MEGVTFAFIALPALAAVVSGYLLTDWRLAGALGSGGFGLLFLLTGIGGPVALLLPLIAGAAVTGIVLLGYLYWRPDASVWGRMGVALTAVMVLAAVTLYALVAST